VRSYFERYKKEGWFMVNVYLNSKRVHLVISLIQLSSSWYLVLTILNFFSALLVQTISTWLHILSVWKWQKCGDSSWRFLAAFLYDQFLAVLCWRLFLLLTTFNVLSKQQIRISYWHWGLTKIHHGMIKLNQHGFVSYWISTETALFSQVDSLRNQQS